MNSTDISKLVGNEAIKSHLNRMVSKQAIANSLLFSGPDGIGKSLFALALAAMVITQNDPTGSHQHKIETGNHPDIHIYRPEGKIGMHSIASMRQLCEDVYLAPYEAEWKVFIIHDAERMLSYSSNALLKTFEEPAPNTLIILVSGVPELLLPTVLSRCRVVHFQSLSQAEIMSLLKERYQFEQPVLEALAYQSNGSIGRAIALAEQGGDPNRDFVLKILSQGKFGTYKALTQAVQVINEHVEARKKLVEDAARLEMSKVPKENLTATQQQVVEKELEGLISMRSVNEAAALFSIVQSWYRDLHLIHVQGNREFLFNRDYISSLEKNVGKGTLLPMEDVEKAIKEVQLALQRSTSLTICLENLFLKLNLL